MKNIQMEFPEVGNTITKIKILKEWFYSSLDKAQDLISEILKIVVRKYSEWEINECKICKKS